MSKGEQMKVHVRNLPHEEQHHGAENEVDGSIHNEQVIQQGAEMPHIEKRTGEQGGTQYEEGPAKRREVVVEPGLAGMQEKERITLEEGDDVCHAYEGEYIIGCALVAYGETEEQVLQDHDAHGPVVYSVAQLRVVAGDLESGRRPEDDKYLNRRNGVNAQIDRAHLTLRNSELKNRVTVREVARSDRKYVVARLMYFRRGFI